MPSQTKTVRIATADGESEGFAAFPGDGERHPAVLLYPDAFGLRPVLEEMVVELAGHGYHVLAPHFLYRDGPVPLVELPGHIGEEARPEILGKLMPSIEAHLTGEQVERDADAYLRFLAAQPEVADGPVAVTGYCIGASSRCGPPRRTRSGWRPSPGSTPRSSPAGPAGCTGCSRRSPPRSTSGTPRPT